MSRREELDIARVLSQYKHLTVYGLSPNADKPSHRVPLFMRSQGYDVVGVYPGQKEIAGFPIFERLSDVPLPYRKFVDVFRKPADIPLVVDEALKAGGVEVLWLQLGIQHPEAEAKARAGGLTVISDRCLHIEYERINSP